MRKSRLFPASSSSGSTAVNRSSDMMPHDNPTRYHRGMATKAMLSEAEYLRTSFPGVDQEYRDGELVERSMPTFGHGRTQAKLTVFFARFEATHRLIVTIETRLRLRRGF